MKQARIDRRATLLHRAVGAAALMAAIGCADGQPQPEAPTSLAKVRVLIGSAACDSDAQCRTVPIGAKACGGPEAWLAWSVVGTDADALRAEARRQAKADRQESAKNGMASNCSVVVDPGAWCAPATTASAARSCRLRSSGPGGSKPIY